MLKKWLENRRIKYEERNEIPLYILSNIHIGNPQLIKYDNGYFSYKDFQIKEYGCDYYLYVGNKYIPYVDQKLLKKIWVILESNYRICEKEENMKIMLEIFK